MVIGEPSNSEAMPPPPPPQAFAQKATIDNIMSGIENTGAVKMNNHRKKLRQRFDIIKKLGQGTYGKVQLGINKETGQEVAIKTIKKSKIETDADLIRIRREVQIMSSVQHPNIIHIYEVFENREKMVLVMEFAAGGELYDYLSERKVLTEDEARRIFRQVSTAIYYCHKHKICHRDLKLENILLDEHGNAKIADFGLSNVFDEQRLLATFCGSPLYASPEIVKGTPYLGPEVDCWSLGVLLYTLVYGAMPFDGANFKRLVKQISQGDYFEPKKPSRASPLVREMLTVCPQRRASIEQICNHWWVNEGYNESCLSLAEELAVQTPVRLDVLLSLAPPAIEADHLLVGTEEEKQNKERLHRSHSVGSIVDMPGGTEAERRIMDMVAAGGEAALMPSPTRTITPAESPLQTKRKLEATVSMENAAGLMKKKEKQEGELTSQLSKLAIPETMDVDETPTNSLAVMPEATTPTEEDAQPTQTEEVQEETIDEEQPPIPPPPIVPLEEEPVPILPPSEVLKDLQNLGDLCDELLKETSKPSKQTQPVEQPSEVKEETLAEPQENPLSVKTKAEKLEKLASKKLINKNKTSDLASTLRKVDEKRDEEIHKSKSASAPERKSSLTDETKPTAERRKSRILETAEKFQKMNNQNNEKYNKMPMTGSGVSSFKKEFERKASLASAPATSIIKFPERVSPSSRKSSSGDIQQLPEAPQMQEKQMSMDEIKDSDSKTSISSFSLEDARRSMENSIALLNRAKVERSGVDIDQLVQNNPEENEIEKKKKAAREIIGNAIPMGKLAGIRKPPMPFGTNGRSPSGTVTLSSKFRLGDAAPAPRPVEINDKKNQDDTTKTSRAEITLKSATLPRRKPPKMETTENQNKPEQQQNQGNMRFSTEIQHQIPDLRSAPIQEHPLQFMSAHHRANSLEPQHQRESQIPMQKPPSYQRNIFGPRVSLSRQSTNESNDSDPSLSQSQIPTSANTSTATMPIKKSPREFIIPIAVEGGGYVAPRANSLEPSESASTNVTSSFASKRMSRPKLIGRSLFNDRDSEEDLSFPRLNRHASLGRESDSEEPRFHTMHRLRSSRPTKTSVSVDPNDSASSGEDDDEDGFEILTAENLFSTLLSRVRALTNRLNVNEPRNMGVSGFPTSRLLNNLRQNQAAQFWAPFESRLSNTPSAWRHSMSRDLGSDIDSMFSRSGATLPRGMKTKSNQSNQTNEASSSSQFPNNSSSSSSSSYTNFNKTNKSGHCENLDLGDLDLSQLRLSKKDLEMLSSITPSLSARIQEQLLAQLPPQQARKLSRTLSMQNGNSSVITTDSSSKIYKRSLSSSRAVDGKYRPLSSIIDEKKYEDHSDILSPPDDFSNKGKFPYSYEKYTPFSEHGHERSKSLDLDNKYSTLPPTPRAPCFSPTKEISNRPPSGSSITSPPQPLTLAQKQQKRISRFLRADFFDPPKEEANEQEHEAPVKEKLTVKKRDKSTDRLSYFVDKYQKQNENEHEAEKAYQQYKEERDRKDRSRRSVSKPREIIDANLQLIENLEKIEKLQKSIEKNEARRSLSKPKEILEKNLKALENNPSAFVDKILDELHNMAILQDLNHLKTSQPPSYPPPEPPKPDPLHNMVILQDLVKLSQPPSYPPPEPPKEDHIDEKVADTSEAKDETDKSTSEPIKKKIIKKIIKKKDADGNIITTIKRIKKSANGETTEECEVISESKEENKRESKLIRPKSYPSKEPEAPKKATTEPSVAVENVKKEKTPEPVQQPISKIPQVKSEPSKIARPKSFPSSKLAPPKEIKAFKVESDSKAFKAESDSKDFKIESDSKAFKSEMDSKAYKSESDSKAYKSESDSKAFKAENNAGILGAIIKKEKTPSPPKENVKEKSKSPPKEEIVEDVPKEPTKKVKKVIKIVKKKVPKPKSDEKIEPPKEEPKEDDKKEKSPDKKVKQGFLASIGQKLEKFRDSSKVNKEKKSNSKSEMVEAKEEVVNNNNEEEKTATTPSANRKSRIDTVIRNLRELSVPRTFGLTESTLIKRAVSVEEIPGSFSNANKSSVNKMFGLFRKSTEKESKVVNTKSTSHINSMDQCAAEIKEKMLKEKPKKKTENNHYNCPDCNKEKKSSEECPVLVANNDVRDQIKNNRRSLMLDFSQIKNKPLANPSFLSPLHHDAINNNFSKNAPCYDSLTNYSSGSRSSPYDDCISPNTYMSPVDEHELYFDDWSSICSDDHATRNSSPSYSYSRSSSTFRGTSPINENESVAERIRRKSYYTKYNEKKPKRVSTIVGTQSVREYYRDRSLVRSVKSKTPSMPSSLDQPPLNYRTLPKPSMKSNNHHDDDTDSRKSIDSDDSSSIHLHHYPPVPHHHHHYHHHALPTSNSARRLNYDYENSNVTVSNIRNTLLYNNTPSPPSYTTYSSTNATTPTGRRRSSITSNESNSNSYLYNTTSTSNNLTNTLGAGRVIRPYGSRSISLLNGTGQRDQLQRHSTLLNSQIHTTPASASVRNFRLRTSSIPRSPTNA